MEGSIISVITVHRFEAIIVLQSIIQVQLFAFDWSRHDIQLRAYEQCAALNSNYSEASIWRVPYLISH